MDFSSFLTSLGTSAVIFLVLMFLFAWLSRKPGNKEVYYPNRILKGMDPWEGGSATRNPFAWIREAMSSNEQDVIKMSGVDTAVYFVFLSTVLGILVLSGIVLLPVLLPVAITAAEKPTNATSEGTFNQLDKLAMGNIAQGSPRLWAFLIATYWVSVVTYILLWKAYKHVAGLRAEALMSPELKTEQFCALVRDMPSPPEGQTRKEQVDSYFRAIYPDTYYRSLVVTDNKKAIKIWEDLEAYKKKLLRGEAIFMSSKTTSNPEGTRPTHKIGLLGLVGRKVDTIEYCTEKVNELTPQLEAEQKTALREKQQGAALVFFTNRVTAAAAAQSLHAQMVDTWTVTESPEPCQVEWTNLTFKFFERTIRSIVVYFIVALTILFYMIPIGLVSAVTTLQNLQKLLPFIKPLVKIKPITTILEAYLPQIALIVFLAMLPKLLLFLSKSEGITSRSHMERAASGKYFYFSVLNVFIGVTIGGSLFSTFKDIEKDPNSIFDLLAASLPGSATFFITFVALKFFVGYGLELSRIIPLIVFHLKKKYLCKTDAEVKDAWFPGDLKYATRIPSDLLIITIVFCYSVIAPIIIPFGVLYFALGWLLLRNQALKVYVPSYESYGRMWPHIHKRLIAALLLFQLTMFAYFGVKKFVYTLLLIPLPIISLVFAFICNKKFYKGFDNTPLEVACRELKETPNPEQIYKSYIPASLGHEKRDDDFFADAFSNVSRGSIV